MKIVLITPPYYVPLTDFAISVGQPLGICYVGAALREAGHEVHLLDGLMSGRLPDKTPADLSGDEEDMIRISNGVFARNPLGGEFPEGASTIGLSFEEIETYLRAMKPDVVGISTIFTSIAKSGFHVAKIAKTLNPDVVTIMGGTHVTVSPKSVLENESVDYIITGEGEKTCVELLEAIGEGRVPDDIAGVGYRTGKDTTHHLANELNWELDELPFPALDLLNMDDYFETMAEGRAGKMYTTRGCPFNCAFCSVPLTSNRRFRVHSTERVVAEAQNWVDTYGAEVLIFEDDNINTKAKRFREMLLAFKDANVNARLDARNLRCDLLDLETLSIMANSGFETVWITPESGSQRVMDEIINKKMKVSESREAVARILGVGLDVGVAFVIGFPGEKRSEIQQTIDYAYELKDMGVKNFWFSIATPIEGTALYKTALEDGLITGIDLDRFTYNMATYDTDEFKASELMQWREDLMGDLNEYASATCGKPIVMKDAAA